MSSLLTKQAIEIIKRAPPRGPLRAPAGYADALPDEAAGFKHLLRSGEIDSISRTYNAADKLALRGQKQFNGMAWSAACAGFLAALLGGLLFYMNALSAGSAFENTVWAAQYLCLFISVVVSFVVGRLKPFLTWRDHRRTAEKARRDFFAAIVAPTPLQPDTPIGGLLLPLKLECFRRHLLEGQLTYFGDRGADHKRTVRRWRVARIVAATLIVAAGAPLLVHLESMSWLPEWMRESLALIPFRGDTARKTYWFAGLVGGFLQGFITLATSISLAERNAEEYEAMTKRLASYQGKVLDDVRASAAQSDQASVGTYAMLILEDLAVEAKDWDAWHKSRSEMALKLLGQAKVSPPGGVSG
jgi:hypothetical protein